MSMGPPLSPRRAVVRLKGGGHQLFPPANRDDSAKEGSDRNGRGVLVFFRCSGRFSGLFLFSSLRGPLSAHLRRMREIKSRIFWWRWRWCWSLPAVLDDGPGAAVGGFGQHHAPLGRGDLPLVFHAQVFQFAISTRLPGVVARPLDLRYPAAFLQGLLEHEKGSAQETNV